MEKINIANLADLLLGRWRETRTQVREEISNYGYHIDPSLEYHKIREKTLNSLGYLAESGLTRIGFPVSLGGRGSPGEGMAIFEELIFADASTQIKYGVQFGLFGSAIMHLGTQKHHDRFLPDIISFKTPGCFAMTETGHGSDVANIETTATYNHATREIIINTPSKSAWKDYIGNAAKHGKVAVVFAQLIVEGENHGVHAVYVPFRNRWGRLLPGVLSEDDGYKGGLNGIDNGRLAFNNVRVPKSNLLNRYGDISDSGEYSSPIESRGRRFFTMLGTLVQGRVSLVGAVTNAEKLALHIALSYSHERSQFKVGDEEQFIIDYKTHQKRLYPRLASVYAQIGMHQDLADLFHQVFLGGEGDTEEARSLLETNAASAKAISTWNALTTIQAAREACGGQGYLSENRLVELRKDLDVYATFEGDNHVLLQLVAKRLLSDYAIMMKQPSLSEMKEYISHKIIDNLHVGSLLGNLKDIRLISKRPKSNHNTVLSNANEILSSRVRILTAEVADEFSKAKKRKESVESAFSNQQIKIIELGKAYAEYQQFLGIESLIAKSNEESSVAALEILRAIHLINNVESNALFYSSRGILSDNLIRELIRYQEEVLFEELRQIDLELVDAFGLTKRLVRAPIGLGLFK
jgi:acyl-CoA oxidase